MHYYKFNIADWHLGTSHLSLEEEAIYFRLINFYYDSEKPIPMETQSVFRRLRLGSHSEAADLILDEFFEQTESGWIHKRCDNILKDYRKTSKKNKANGAKGGRPSHSKASSVTQTKPSGLPNESQNNPNQEPRTTNQELLTTNQEPRTKEKRNKRFVKPTHEELRIYFETKEHDYYSATEEANKFLDHFNSNGWKIGGKAPMKSWKSAVNTWVGRNKNSAQGIKSAKQAGAEAWANAPSEREITGVIVND